MKRKQVSGQAILLVVLTLAVVLTLILSVVSRSITDVKVTSVEEESVRAFSAAEAGIERHLTDYSYTFSPFTINDVEVTGNITPKYENQSEMNYPEKLKEGEVATVWFVDHDDNGNLTCGAGSTCYAASNANNANLRLCWGETGGIDAAAEISIYYAFTPGNYSDIRVARYAVDSSAGRRAINNFKPNQRGLGGCTSVGSEGIGYRRRVTIDLDDSGSERFNIPDNVIRSPNGLLFARIRFFYNGSVGVPFGVTLPSGGGNNVFASQARLIQSSGKFGEAERKVEITALYPDLPPIFDYSLFALGGGVSQ